MAQYLINEENEYIEKIVDYLRLLGAEEYATLLETFMTENDIENKSDFSNDITSYVVSYIQENIEDF